MADQFSIAGSYQTTPSFGSPSGVAGIAAPIDEPMVLIKKDYDTVTLDVDAPVAVPMVSGMAGANVVILKAVGGKVRARLTSSDGVLQAVPVDSFAVVISRSVLITALDLTRVPGQLTTVDVFLGQNS